MATIALMALAPAGALATTLLDVSRPPNSGASVGSDEAVAVSFILLQDVTDFSISAPITCIACSGGIWLQRNVIGASASFADSVGATAFGSSSSSPLFSLGALSAGTYFLILSIDSGTGIWLGSNPAVVTSNGATRGLDFAASTTSPFVPLSNFSVTFGAGLNFTVNGTLPLPEPGTAWLGCAGLLALLARARRAHGVK